MFKLWVDSGILTPQQINLIEDRIQCFKVPPDVGRIPYRISSNYGGFTASQWRNWITIYSPVVLKGILDQQHLQCWLLFVRACSLLSQRIITKEDVASADLFLLTFCKQIECLYGKDQFTPNMHLHMHLKQCLMDFGPSHSFWCFSFERFNGLLGSYSTNKKAIEVQVMRKFCTAQHAYSLIPYADSDLQNVLPLAKNTNTSLSTVFSDDSSAILLLKMSHAPLDSIPSFENIGAVTLLPPLREQVFSFNECCQLKKIYSQLYPSATIAHMSHFYICCKQVTLGGDIIGSVKCGNASSVIMAYWPGQGDDLSTINYASRMRVGVVQYYIKHTISLTYVYSTPEESRTYHFDHVFARVAWKQKHPNEDHFGISATVCFDLFESSNACTFLPVQRISCRCAHAVLPIEIAHITENLFVACPLPIKYSL